MSQRRGARTLACHDTPAMTGRAASHRSCSCTASPTRRGPGIRWCPTSPATSRSSPRPCSATTAVRRSRPEMDDPLAAMADDLEARLDAAGLARGCRSSATRWAAGWPSCSPRAAAPPACWPSPPPRAGPRTLPPASTRRQFARAHRMAPIGARYARRLVSRRRAAARRLRRADRSPRARRALDGRRAHPGRRRLPDVRALHRLHGGRALPRRLAGARRADADRLGRPRPHDPACALQRLVSRRAARRALGRSARLRAPAPARRSRARRRADRRVRGRGRARTSRRADAAWRARSGPPSARDTERRRRR